MSDIVSFCRQLKWRTFWLDNSSQNQQVSLHPALKKFREPSKFEPPSLPSHHPVELYCKQLLQRASDPALLNNFQPSKNLTRDEYKALKNLQSDESIMILPADKGNTTVILDRQSYLEEADRQLSDTDFYLRLNEDPNPSIASDIREYIKSHGPREGLNPLDIATMLPQNFRTAHFYLLPKIHKQGTPGRPIVASYDCPTEKISAFVDYHLQPLVTSRASYIKDSFHFLEILNALELPTHTQEHLLLVTADVKSLYTNIPHREGLEALEYYLSSRSVPYVPSTEFLLKLAEFVLTKNVFTFEGEVYIQTKGTAMGTKMAPSYANLFMAHLEETLLKDTEKKPVVWKRFIDDIFFVWQHGEEELINFMTHLNSSFSVSFTYVASQYHATFLDIDIELANNKFHTSIHIKPTNKMQYLHYSSCHPPHTKKSIAYSQSLRAHRICSSSDKRSEYLHTLRNSLQSRDYPNKLLTSKILPADPRRLPKKRPYSSNPPLNICTEYFPGIQEFKRILKDLNPILQSDPVYHQLFTKPPSLVFKGSPNLKSLLRHKSPLGCSTPGTYPCGRPRCKTCPMINSSTLYSTANNPKDYKIVTRSTCTSSNLVYLLKCRHCASFYVGETTTLLSLRMNNHRDSVKKHPEFPVASHAISHRMTFDNCFTVQVIHLFSKQTPELTVKTWESSHIWILGGHFPPGLNTRK